MKLRLDRNDSSTVNYSTRVWLITLTLAFVTAVVIAVYAVTALLAISSPPPAGNFKAALNGPQGTPSNITDTLFEHVVDELSGNRVPVLLFQQSTKYCGGPESGEMKTIACVSRFSPNHIAFQEELANHLQSAWVDAEAKGLTKDAQLLNQWESHIAAHEFAHILQYNYRAETLPYLSNFAPKEIPAVELMADCYANLIYPMGSERVSFHNFPKEENFTVCTKKQSDAALQWAGSIGWTPAHLAKAADVK